MKEKNLKICCTILFIILILFSSFGNTINNISAAINQTYNTATGGMSAVDDPNTEHQLSTSKVSDALGQFVLGIASLVEKLVSWVFRSVTGTNEFPWADRIIFNALPFLDVNFFSPSDNSFFLKGGNDTQIAKVVRNTYFTILSICLAFLTIVVAIAAIKMAITSLAAEKAKYKEAITKWLFSIVLIFLMHNLMSFIFFVNEAMVEVASNILINSLENFDGAVMKKRLENKLTDKQMVENFIAGNENLLTSDEWVESIKSDEHIALTAALLRNKDFRETVLKYASDDDNWDKFKNFMSKAFERVITGNLSIANFNNRSPIFLVYFTIELAENEDKLEELEKAFEPYRDFTLNGTLKDQLGIDNFLTDLMTALPDRAIRSFFKTVFTMTEAARSLRENYIKNSAGVWVLKSQGEGENDFKVNIIANLAEILRESAYTYSTDDEGNVTGWKPTTVSISGALIYAIFIAQSILYFIAYIKRFFYIIVLAIMAPVIVLFDFLGKALG